MTGTAAGWSGDAASSRSGAEPPTGAEGGRIIFRTVCASCHGTDAKGTGPIAESLKVPPPDLTGIAERNGGYFPPDGVAARIDGRIQIAIHGPSEMPVWGDGLAYALPEGEEREERITAAISMLVEYLESIQR